MAHFGRFVELDVAAQAVALLGRLVFHRVRACRRMTVSNNNSSKNWFTNVEDDNARFEPVAAHKVRFAHRRDQNVRLLDDRGQIRRLRVAERHRRVAAAVRA